MQDGAEREFRLALDNFKKLIDAGKEKRYLTYNEKNDLISRDVLWKTICAQHQSNTDIVSL